MDDCGFEAKVLSASEESTSRLQPEQAKLHLCSSLQDVLKAQEGISRRATCRNSVLSSSSSSKTAQNRLFFSPFFQSD